MTGLDPNEPPPMLKVSVTQSPGSRGPAVAPTVPVTGLANTRVLKSNLMRQIASEQVHTVCEHAGLSDVTLVCSKKVKFCEADWPQPRVTAKKHNSSAILINFKFFDIEYKYSQVQQTPNPSAHDPSAVPPAFEHSSLLKEPKRQTVSWAKAQVHEIQAGHSFGVISWP